nr:Rv2231c family pyridoxal phosphate-dependent protein CobC [Nocardioides sp. R-C-SC26]
MASTGPDLHHHGDAEATAGLLDLAVNVYSGDRPEWLESALLQGIRDSTRYPDAGDATAAVASRHARSPDDVLLTAGAAEAFTLLARARPWQRAVVVHPQFTEPHAALLAAGHDVTAVVLPEPFGLDPALVPDDADLVVVGNPTNPTGVLHPAATVQALLRPGRVVLVDEAFMDAVPGEHPSLTGDSELPGLLVSRSLTKHWSMPGIRAGYVVGDAAVVASLRAQQAPWALSTPALAATLACSTPMALAESERRATELRLWRTHLAEGLTRLGVHHVPSGAPFVLARVGDGVHARLRDAGIAVRRADTFPGLDASWVRIAARPPVVIDVVLDRLADLCSTAPTMP